MQPLIITLRLNAATEAILTALRTRYFPRQLNHLSSHITLFHALPGTSQHLVSHQLQHVTSAMAAFTVQVSSPFAMGKKGVALNVVSSDIGSLHKQLLDAWKAEKIALTSQDDNVKKHAHVTVQNKVGEEVARKTLGELTAQWEPKMATAEGLRLWRYEQGGEWTFLEEFRFQDRNWARQ
ncbi:hypothetical protein BP6252_09845 [Coleophoma cylindrospora]|uniref:2'-5' RNA ligase superfamily-domain-containing protein n=1 Tax=Coleophoma cylindrospora TaxID=1849047 RepID=A0A3D8QWY2_9HELO|nr:hypothetical protein BP6252_09845 [Coleophoma cylindrospora]